MIGRQRLLAAGVCRSFCGAAGGSSAYYLIRRLAVTL